MTALGLDLRKRGFAFVQDYLQSPEFDKLKLLHPHLKFVTELASDLMNIKGLAVHLKKTVMNLIINAAEAQCQEGVVTISTYNQYVDRPITGYDDVQEGDYVVLGVREHGDGIAPDDLSRIFEPFYSKKVMGRSGTGLGMAVVWGTVQDHHCYIQIDSEKDKGTVLRLYFPATREHIDRQADSVPLDLIKGNGERILVVDDVLEQREIASVLLGSLGYEVDTASSGENAVTPLAPTRCGPKAARASSCAGPTPETSTSSGSNGRTPRAPRSTGSTSTWRRSTSCTRTRAATCGTCWPLPPAAEPRRCCGRSPPPAATARACATSSAPYVCKLLEGSAVDDSYFGVIYTIDADDDWTDEATWAKANPNLGVSVSIDDLRSKCSFALQMPSAQSNFLTKHLNVWVNADSAWMDMRKWDACARPALRLEDFAGQPGFAGLDLASKVDVACRALVFEKHDRKIAAFLQHWLPERAIEIAANSQYDGWARAGHISVTEGEVIDLDAIEQTVIDDCKTYQIAEVGFDPFQATQMSGHLLDEGLPMVEVRPTVLNFSEPMKQLEAWVLSGDFEHNGDPVLTCMVSNVVCHRDQKDNIYPRKERPENKIDGVVALLIAINRLLSKRADGGSVYNQIAREQPAEVDA